MGNKPAKSGSQTGKGRTAAPPRLNVALSVLDTVRVLPAFFGEAIGAFHASLSSTRVHAGTAKRYVSQTASGGQKGPARKFRPVRFSHE